MTRPLPATKPPAAFDSRIALAIAISIGVTVLLYVVPGGRTIAWPLVLLSTVAHEMGHGVAGLLVGGTFDSLEIWSDASGVAHVGRIGGGLASAIVSAGGLVGPAIAGAVSFAFARRPKLARWFLLALGAAFALSLVLYVRSLFGFFFIGLLSAVLVLIAMKGRETLSQVTLVFLGVQLSLSVFSRGDYLFTDTAKTGAGTFPSDVANMATALFPPYWLWGALCGAFSVAVLVLGTRLLLGGLLRRSEK